jgi:hypothetical protein
MRTQLRAAPAAGGTPAGFRRGRHGHVRIMGFVRHTIAMAAR